MKTEDVMSPGQRVDAYAMGQALGEAWLCVAQENEALDRLLRNPVVLGFLAFLARTDERE